MMTAQDDLNAAVTELETDATSMASLIAAKVAADGVVATALQTQATAAAALNAGQTTLMADVQAVKAAADALATASEPAAGN